MKKVMAFGTFDIFHEGHKSYLEQAKALGEYLIVVVARDETVTKVRREETLLRQGSGGQARNSEEERREVLEKSGLADEVILGDLEDKYAVIEKYRPSMIALGYDQVVDLAELTEQLKKRKLKAEIVRLKAFEPEKYKSSKLRK
jgi:FAD synthetase